MDAAQRFAIALTNLFDQFDWTDLGLHYCFEGGEEFFDEAARSALLEAQIGMAAELGELLPTILKRGPKRSLYIGAALSELGPMLAEQILLGREVEPFSLDNRETRELNRCLRQVSESVRAPLASIQVADFLNAQLQPYDQLWMVSVLNDPEAFPALHDMLYQRTGSDLAMGDGDLQGERKRARAIAHKGLSGLALPGLLTTSDEELPLVVPVAEGLGLKLTALCEPILSALVQDPIRFWKVESSVRP